MAKRQSTIVIDDLKPVVEALLFASDEPLSSKQLRVLIEGEKKSKKKKLVAVEAVVEEVAAEAPAEESLGTSGELEAIEEEEDKGGLDARTVRAIVDALNADYEAAARAFVIIEIAGGFQFATRKEFGLYVGRLAKDKSRRRLSQAALETLAIVAYRQPISKPDVEGIRGVNCDEVLSSLMERSLITIVGRAESVGRPLLYGTTDDFLKYFGLVSLKDLPRPREIDEMMEARGILNEQMLLELSADENVAQIEEHLTHHFPANADAAAIAEVAETLGMAEAIAIAADDAENPTVEDSTEFELLANDPDATVIVETIAIQEDDDDDDSDEDDDLDDDDDLDEDDDDLDDDVEDDPDDDEVAQKTE